MNQALTEVRENLKNLNLSAMARELEVHLRQAKETGVGYDEYLLELTRVELQARAESRLQRRIREAKFPLFKPMETFDFNALILGIEACKKNRCTRFATCYGLVNELIEARQEKTLQRLLQKYGRYDLLILDKC